MLIQTTTRSSIKQRCVSLLSTETEYVALSKRSKPCVSLKKLFKGLGAEDALVTEYNDSQSVLYISMFASVTDHNRIFFHFIHTCTSNEEFIIKYIPTTKMPVDVIGGS